jgi:D-alanyl-D-alanine carboxypeptidase/D-alanyl-D-alanine-endopeptidase (penicillin-binding protein 4)
MIAPGRSHRAASALAAVVAAALLTSGTAPLSGAAAAPPASVRRLQHDLDTVLSAPALRAATWGVDVRSLSRHEPLFEANREKLLVPSSNMKIVTLAAAAERLGWDYTFETRVAAAGTIANGMLDGDLVVVGSGDPTIEDWAGDATRLFGDWAAQLKTAGVRAIGGRIVGDDRAFEDDGFGTGWAWDDLDRSYATPVGALQFNENTGQIVVAPGAREGAPAEISTRPPSATLAARNMVRTGARGTLLALASQRLPGSTMLDIRGSIPLGFSPVVRNVSVVNPTLYFVNHLRSVLVANGIEVRGPAVDINDMESPPARERITTIVTHRSAPLSELSGTMMRLSQNLYAETLLRALGAWAGTPTAAGGITAIRRVMDNWNVPAAAYEQADGSGLSRYNLVTADTFVSILTHVDGDARLRAPFRNALPAAGRDGTLENRMKGTPAQGNAQAKSGSLNNARALSGYVTSADGEPLVFSIIANNFGVPAEVVDKAIDTVVVRLAQFSRK